MKRVAKIDANQPEIVAAFRQAGCYVEHTYQLGGGVPDIWVSKGPGRSCWVEIKDGSKSPSQQKLTVKEAEWRMKCPDPGHIINSVEQAFQLAASL